MAKMVEHLPSKGEALSTNPVPAKEIPHPLYHEETSIFIRFPKEPV
jgi:hypothetical protein